MRWDDLARELEATPGFCEQFDREYPYHDVSLAVAGLRADLDLTQAEFGALVGIPQSTVARLESGQHNPSVGTLKRIAQATESELVVEFRPMGRRRRPRRGDPDEVRRTDPELTRGHEMAASGRYTGSRVGA